MKNEFQQVGYFKRKSIVGVLETKVDLWGIRNQIQHVGYWERKSRAGVLWSHPRARGIE